MDFAFDDDHIALRDAVQRFCDGHYPAQHRGNPEDPATAARRWQAMAELGLLGLGINAELGGSGQGAVEQMLVAQQLGRALGGGAWLASTVLAAPLLAEAGTPAQCNRWLPALARGERQIALACQEADARHDAFDVSTTARPDGPGWRLDGHKSLVLSGDSADLLLVVARTAGVRRDRDGLTLFAVEADAIGLQRQGFDTLDGRRAAHLHLQDLHLPTDSLLGPLHGAAPLLDAALDRANAMLVADAAGALDALLDLCCEHLRSRRQFGAPLAKFQVLQHRIADFAIALEETKSMACAAAMAVAEGDAGRRARIVSAAKARVAPLGRQMGLLAIQLHGAMGMTDECRVGHYAKRLMTTGLLFGDAAFHLQRFAAA